MPVSIDCTEVLMLCLSSALRQPYCSGELAASWCLLRQNLCAQLIQFAQSCSWAPPSLPPEQACFPGKGPLALARCLPLAPAVAMRMSLPFIISQGCCWSHVDLIVEQSVGNQVDQLSVNNLQFLLWYVLMDFTQRWPSSTLHKCFYQQRDSSSHRAVTSALQPIRVASCCGNNRRDRVSQPVFHPLDHAVL